MEHETVGFLTRAKRACYAGKGAEAPPSRPSSHEYAFTEGDLKYIDTCAGERFFTGEEALWRNGAPFWAMNCTGRVTGEGFSGDFLKKALMRVQRQAPFRGPPEYTEGSYACRCEADGGPGWFSGSETICRDGRPIYELLFHGGAVR